MSLQYLLDTNVVSAAMAKEPNPEVLRRLDLHGHACGIASLVWHELVFGVGRLPPSRRREALEAFLEDVVRKSFPVLDYDERAAAWHAGERVRLEAAGTVVRFVDGQIAAIAHTSSLTLVTANVRDFRPFSGLVVEDWSKKGRAAR